jgi:hypothetical protein
MRNWPVKVCTFFCGCTLFVCWMISAAVLLAFWALTGQLDDPNDGANSGI